MNRAQRRKNKSQFKVEVCAPELRKIVTEELKKTYDEATDYATKRMVALFVLALHDKEGFGPVRLNRVIAAVNNSIDCINAGTVTIDDIYNFVANDLKISI